MVLTFVLNNYCGRSVVKMAADGEKTTRNLACSSDKCSVCLDGVCCGHHFCKVSSRGAKGGI